MGYERIGGVELTRDRFQALASRVQDRIMHDLAEFLNALHRADGDIAHRFAVPSRDLHAYFADVFTRAERKVVPLLAVDTAASFVRRSGEILEDASLCAVAPALIHGDLGPDHIFFDPVAERISGVIDSGDMVSPIPITISCIFSKITAMRSFKPWFASIAIPIGWRSSASCARSASSIRHGMHSSDSNVTIRK